MKRMLIFFIASVELLFTSCMNNEKPNSNLPDESVTVGSTLEEVTTEATTTTAESTTVTTSEATTSEATTTTTEAITTEAVEEKIIIYAPEPFDVNADEYRFMYENLECVIDLEYFEIEPDEFDIRKIEEYPFEDDVDYPNKRPITSLEEATAYGVEIFMQQGLFTPDEPTWLLLAVMRDEVNDAWGVSFSPAPLCPGLGVEYTFYSDGGGIVSSYYE